MSQHQISNQGYLEPVTRQATAILVSSVLVKCMLYIYAVHHLDVCRPSLTCLGNITMIPVLIPHALSSESSVYLDVLFESNVFSE